MHQNGPAPRLTRLDSRCRSGAPDHQAPLRDHHGVEIDIAARAPHLKAGNGRTGHGVLENGDGMVNEVHRGAAHLLCQQAPEGIAITDIEPLGGGDEAAGIPRRGQQQGLEKKNADAARPGRWP